MKLIKSTILVLAASILFTSCASKYELIKPKTLNYSNVSIDKGVSVSYKYNLLDKRYAKKEEKKGVKIVAIEIKNNSGKDLVLGKNFELEYSNGKKLYTINNMEAYKMVKQSTAIYSLYFLLSFLKFEVTKTTPNEIKKDSYPVGLIVGPGIAVGNMVASSNANGKFEKEMMEYDLTNAVIKKGETKYGLISVISDDYQEIVGKIIN
ncbi:hypothetical protein [Aureivirga sp. CE67]|uniref:hypothetical protein n=1 Tax=Aureivirga sp. CE67 TaxID=1788983 RepID=UPI0018CA6377|nr:hypothetical protein [Aureivirga sp. CE67]